MDHPRPAPSAHYLALTDDEQAQALRPAAVEAAGRFGLAGATVDLAAHAYNTTFRITAADGRRFALRLGTGSLSTPRHLVAQQQWLRAIAAETDVLVPEPLATVDGDWHTTVDSKAYGGPLLVTAASWLEGPDVGDCDEEVAHALGRAMATLHRQAAGWSVPEGGELPLFDTPLFGDRDRLAELVDLSPDDRDVLTRTAERTAAAFARLYDGTPLRPLHADLHGQNLKWHGGRLAVFDFDDCGLGVPALDLAVSAFYLRDGDPGPERAMRAGYEELAAWPDVDPADFDTLLADRQLLLTNVLVASSTNLFRDQVAAYVPLALARLRRWLDTGVFSRAPLEE